MRAGRLGAWRWGWGVAGCSTPQLCAGPTLRGTKARYTRGACAARRGGAAAATLGVLVVLAAGVLRVAVGDRAARGRSSNLAAEQFVDTPQRERLSMRTRRRLPDPTYLMGAPAEHLERRDTYTLECADEFPDRMWYGEPRFRSGSSVSSGRVMVGSGVAGSARLAGLEGGARGRVGCTRGPARPGPRPGGAALGPCTSAVTSSLGRPSRWPGSSFGMRRLRDEACSLPRFRR